METTRACPEGKWGCGKPQGWASGADLLTTHLPDGSRVSGLHRPPQGGDCRAALLEPLQTYRTLAPAGRAKCLHPDQLRQGWGLLQEPARTHPTHSGANSPRAFQRD